MDIISEILNAEKLAEDKLRAAEEKSRQLLEDCENESNRLKEKSLEKINAYRAKQNADADAKISETENDIKNNEQIKIDKLNKIYEQNHEKWVSEITNRIITA